MVITGKKGEKLTISLISKVTRPKTPYNRAHHVFRGCVLEASHEGVLPKPTPPLMSSLSQKWDPTLFVGGRGGFKTRPYRQGHKAMTETASFKGESVPQLIGQCYRRREQCLPLVGQLALEL
jgi:hypothetical protein